jgi:hypothetical protein
MAHARAGREANFPAIRLQFTDNGAQQRGFAGAIAPNQANLAPIIHLQARTFQQGAPAEAYGEVSDSQNSHARGL